MGRRSNPARLVLALSVAVVLAVFLVYVSFAGGGTPALQPSELKGRTDKVMLSGRVVGPVTPHGDVYRFRLRDPQGTATVPVAYASGLPDQFNVGRDIRLDGRLVNGVFVGVPGTMITKCPSKYAPKNT
ncbi:MAG TPA: cytochrome c maturation protein CcmE [Gaiellaceae bacterium]|nr:cytochrome c maturation protein CcmE [Gaiellaceae bacterium]